MGASGSVQSNKMDHDKFLSDPSATPPTAKTSSARLSERSALFNSVITAASKKGGTKDKSRGDGEAFEKSAQEDVQSIIRSEIKDSIVGGESLLKSRPTMTTTEKGLGGKRVKLRRSTLLDHVAIPARLPQSLCHEDVEAFQTFAQWEAEVRKLDPWDEKKKISICNTPEDSPKVTGTDEGDNNDNIDDRRAFETPRQDKLKRRVTSKAKKSDKNMEKYLLKPGATKKRGKTFLNMEILRKESREQLLPTIQNPNNNLILSGVSSLLSYLIEEPPDTYVNNQAWDIFSVPGDKTKIRPPLTEAERKRQAGTCVIRQAVVEEYLQTLYKICQWTPECHIIAFILIVRMLKLSKDSKQEMVLHRYNWHCVILVTLMISQKLWDDVSLNNVDFPQVWKMVAPKGGELDLKDINFMEKEFLAIIGYSVTVKMRTYTSCYYEVMSLAILNDEEAVDSLEKEIHAENSLARFSSRNFHVVMSNQERKMSDKIQGMIHQANPTRKRRNSLNRKKFFTQQSNANGSSDSDDDASNGSVSGDEGEDISKRVDNFRKRRNTADIMLRTPEGQRRPLL